jgi:hypothetical protein
LPDGAAGVVGERGPVSGGERGARGVARVI